VGLAPVTYAASPALPIVIRLYVWRVSSGGRHADNPSLRHTLTICDPTDHYFKEAKKAGYVSRAAYKLLEIQNKHKLIKPGALQPRSAR
jgi:hypothetical protein